MLTQLNVRRLLQTETRSYFLQIERMNIEHLFQSISRVGVQIGLEGASGLTVQVVVLLDQRLELLLHMHQLIVRKLVVVELHLGVDEVLQVPLFLR